MEFRRSSNKAHVTCVFDPSRNERLDVYTFQIKVEPPHLEHYDNLRGALEFINGYSDIFINHSRFDGAIHRISIFEEENHTMVAFLFTKPIPTDVAHLKFTMHFSSAWVFPIRLDESLLFLETKDCVDLTEEDFSKICTHGNDRLIQYLIEFQPVFLIGLPSFVESVSMESLARYGIRALVLGYQDSGGTIVFATSPIRNPIRAWFVQGVSRKRLSEHDRYHFEPPIEMIDLKNRGKSPSKTLLYLFILFVCIVGIFIGGLFYKSRVRSES